MKKIKIAVMNTSQEIISMIAAVFEDAGFETITIFTYDLKNGKIDLNKYIEENAPNVVLYDIAIPYDENYNFFLKLSKNLAVKGIPFVLTTTNKDALEELVGKTSAFEIIGKPYDLDELVETVKETFKRTLAVA